MMQKVLSKIESTVETYVNEMIAQGAWCGHMYASDYLKGVFDNCKEILNSVKDSELYTDSGIKLITDEGLWILRDDIDSYITTVYDEISDENIRHRIADFLDDQFLHIIEGAIGFIVSIYEKQTGHLPGDFPEEMQESLA